jgi:hypothetical protein
MICQDHLVSQNQHILIITNHTITRRMNNNTINPIKSMDLLTINMIIININSQVKVILNQRIIVTNHMGHLIINSNSSRNLIDSNLVTQQL